jgi:thioredoxin-like negative regulator of GroEL
MSPDQFNLLLEELRGIRLALTWAAALIVVSVCFAALRTFFIARKMVDQQVADSFQQEAEMLFQTGKLGPLISKCRSMLEERPNHMNARWYLAHALLLQKEWAPALDEFMTLSERKPDWADSVEPFLKHAKRNLGIPPEKGTETGNPPDAPKPSTGDG